MGWVVVRHRNQDNDGTINDEIAETDLDSSLDELIDKQRRQSRSGSGPDWLGNRHSQSQYGMSRDTSPDSLKFTNSNGSSNSSDNGNEDGKSTVFYVLIMGAFIFAIWWFH